VGTLTVTGSGGTGAAASSLTVRLPSSARRYLRLSVVESSAGGDNSAVSATFAILAGHSC
jgi:hypothetical protein